MPLIILCGLPSSGKSTRTQELQLYFEGKGKKVHIVTENFIVPKSGHQKNEYFFDSKNEKMGRADLKSEALRSLNRDDVVILDAGNYIKGYRYELYCASKESRTTKCTLYCAIRKEQAFEFNQKRTVTEDNLSVDVSQLNNSHVAYTKEIFDALCLRFEEPQSNNRWDSPLFTVFPEDKLDLDGINQSLFETKPPKPNQSTQSVSFNSFLEVYLLKDNQNNFTSHAMYKYNFFSCNNIKVF